MPMLYRSPYTRWLLTSVGALAGLLLAFGDDTWRSTPSLKWLAHAQIPLQLWGAAWLLYAVLLIASVRTRPVAYAMGAFLFAVFAVSLFATLNLHDPKNPVVLGAMVDVVVFHAYSIRTAEAMREEAARRKAPR